MMIDSCQKECADGACVLVHVQKISSDQTIECVFHCWASSSRGPFHSIVSSKSKNKKLERKSSKRSSSNLLGASGRVIRRRSRLELMRLLLGRNDRLFQGPGFFGEAAHDTTDAFGSAFAEEDAGAGGEVFGVLDESVSEAGRRLALARELPNDARS